MSVQIVNVRKEGKKIKVHFMYHYKLYDVMKKHKGFWFKKEKCWIFSENKLGELQSDIEKLHHKVSIISDGGKIENIFDDEDIVSVYGHCKKCGNGGFIGRDELCTKCKFSS